jgi:hypothetical protein
MISHTLQEQVISSLREARDLTPIRDMRPASQSGASDTLYLLSDQGEYFLK